MGGYLLLGIIILGCSLSIALGVVMWVELIKSFFED